MKDQTNVNVATAMTRSEVLPMIVAEARTAAITPIPDQCVTIDCDGIASMLIILFGDEVSISWLCHDCYVAAKYGATKLRCANVMPRGAA